MSSELSSDSLSGLPILLEVCFHKPALEVANSECFSGCFISLGLLLETDFAVDEVLVIMNLSTLLMYISFMTFWQTKI